MQVVLNRLHPGVSGTGDLHDSVSDLVWVGDLLEDKLLFRPSGLDCHVSEVEESFYHTACVSRDILNAMTV